MYVLVVAISGGDVVATSVVAKSAPSSGTQILSTFICESVFPNTYLCAFPELRFYGIGRCCKYKPYSALRTGSSITEDNKLMMW